MNLRFETCDRKNALNFLRQFYPSKEILDTEESAKDLLDFVEKDVIRIPDPKFHPGGQVQPSKNWDESLRVKVLSAFSKLTQS